jgi:uncharacterized protein YbjT (DUF2867 family)
MRVFVTDATSFLGSAVRQALLRAGHQVLGLASSLAAAQALDVAGATPQFGTLDDLDSLRRGAEAAEGVIHLLSHSREARATSAWSGKVIKSLGAALAGTDFPLVISVPVARLTPESLAQETAGLGAACQLCSHEVVALRSVTAIRVRVSVVQVFYSVSGIDTLALGAVLRQLAPNSVRY